MTTTNRRHFLRIAGTALAGAVTHARSARAGEAKTRIKVGQIGVGHDHASGTMSTLRKLADDYEVVGVVEPDAELRKAWENHPVYRGLAWMTEEQLLGVNGLQAVAVETRVRDLLPAAARCINAEMHIHLDKPAGESLDEFRKLLEESRRRRLTVQMSYMFRNNPAFQLCFQAVRDGWLGDVFEVHGVMSKRQDEAERQRWRPYPGGAMFILGCHLIDALVAVLGKPERVTPYLRRSRPKPDDMPDNQLAVFEYPRATATIRTSLVEVEGTRRRQFTICGDKGTIDIRPLEPPKVQLALAEPRGPFRRGYQEVELPPMPGRYDAQLLELAAIIRGQQAHPYSPEHDLAVQEAVLLASGERRDGPGGTRERG